jgi:hypothetical protein
VSETRLTKGLSWRNTLHVEKALTHCAVALTGDTNISNSQAMGKHKGQSSGVEDVQDANTAGSKLHRSLHSKVAAIDRFRALVRDRIIKPLSGKTNKKKLLARLFSQYTQHHG